MILDLVAYRFPKSQHVHPPNHILIHKQWCYQRCEMEYFGLKYTTVMLQFCSRQREPFIFFLIQMVAIEKNHA